jgi:hypothetical protein
MKLKGFKIGDATYFCNAKQIEDADSLEAAAQKMHDDLNPPAPSTKVKQEKKSVDPVVETTNEQ